MPSDGMITFNDNSRQQLVQSRREAVRSLRRILADIYTDTGLGSCIHGKLSHCLPLLGNGVIVLLAVVSSLTILYCYAVVLAHVATLVRGRWPGRPAWLLPGDRDEARTYYIMVTSSFVSNYLRLESKRGYYIRVLWCLAGPVSTIVALALALGIVKAVASWLYWPEGLAQRNGGDVPTVGTAELHGVGFQGRQRSGSGQVSAAGSSSISRDGQLRRRQTM
ncbi:hypothetical protein LTR53_000975 [Teratosphaeriaceae sp. CCFEE 6253]|nr:hypothetical protein LTR53_000975 [Teratosphaeriaceae sp. CCFEE 6253]